MQEIINSLNRTETVLAQLLKKKLEPQHDLLVLEAQENVQHALDIAVRVKAEHERCSVQPVATPLKDVQPLT